MLTVSREDVALNTKPAAADVRMIGDTVSIKLEEKQITLKVGDTQLVPTEDTISAIAKTIETVGITNLGLDNKGDTFLPNVLTLGGVPAKKTFAKKA